MIEASPLSIPPVVGWQWERQVTNAGGDRRRLYNTPPQFYCGSDFHARRMSVCRVRHDGEPLVHRTMHAAPAPFRTAMAPDRDGLVGAVEGLCTWEWRAALGAPAALPFVLGHALSMTALHGGQAQND
jgi:hypothetical protein